MAKGEYEESIKWESEEYARLVRILRSGLYLADMPVDSRNERRKNDDDSVGSGEFMQYLFRLVHPSECPDI